VLDRLLAWGWPGNVRELINTMESLVALSVDGVIDPALLPGEGEAALPALGLRERVDAYERGLIVEALRAAGGNQSEAARRLGLPRVTLHDKLRRYGLEG
jgi:transcriptional regulator of acetoin/glycerol metabolism